MAVNGQIITWPDGAVQLKNTAVLDSTFALRAKPALYWAARCVVMLDPALDVAALAKAGRAVRYAQGNFGPKPCHTGRPAV